MKLSYALIIVGITSAIISGAILKYSSPYLTFIGLILSIASLIIGIVWEIQNRKSTELSLEENRLQHLQIIEEVQKVENVANENIKKANDLELTNSKLRQLMNRVTIELQKEDLSKSDILSRIDKPIYALLFHKTEEMNLDNSDLKPLRDSILPSLGFKYVKGCRGLYILTPSLLPGFKDKKELEKWIEEKIVSKMSKKYRYILSFISLIDLRFTISINKDDITKKYSTVMDTIGAEELLTFTEGLSYLQKKKSLSLKDVIEIPNFYFLSDNTSIQFDEREKLKKNNLDIIKKLESQLKSDIKTTSLSTIDSNIIFEILKQHVALKLEDVAIMKDNAEFWIKLFENKYLLNV